MSTRLHLPRGRALLLCLSVVLGAPRVARGQGRSESMSEARHALEKADALMQAGEVKEALQQYENAIAQDPNLEEAYERYSMALFTRRRYNEGERVARNGLSRFPDSSMLKGVLGMHLCHLGKPKEGHRYLKGTYTALRSRFEVQAVAGQCFLNVGDYPAAAGALENYLAARPATLAARDVAFQILQGKALLRKGDVERAGAVIEKVLTARPASLAAKTLVAEIYLLRGDCSRSVVTYEQLKKVTYEQLKKELPPAQLAHLRLQRGRAYFCVRRYRDALAEAETYVKENPASAEGLLLSGDAAMELRMDVRALDDYRRAATRLGKDSAKVNVRIARLLFRQGKYAAVLAQLSENLKAAEPEADALVLALRAAVRAKDPQRAIAYGERLLARKDASAEHYLYAGFAYSSGGKFAQAVAPFQKVLQLSPGNRQAVAALVRALCYQARGPFRKGEYEQAVMYLQQAHRLDPRSLVVNRNLALTYMRAGNDAAALRHMEVVLKKVPNDYVANRLAGRVLLAMGRNNAAMAKYDQALGVALGIGGLALAWTLAEAAVPRLRLGMVDRCELELIRASKLVKLDPSAPARLVDAIHRNLAVVYVLKAVREDDAKAAWTEMQHALRESASLPPAERAMLKAEAALAALAAGDIAEGKALAKELRGKLEDVLAPRFRKLASGFFAAYADYMSPGAAEKQRAAVAFERMVTRAGAVGRSLLALARSGYEQAALLLFRGGKPAQATAALTKAARLSKSWSPQQKHNMAVFSYMAGHKASALAALSQLSARVPTALCNLAVHNELVDDPEKAYELFWQCEKRGGSFAGLKKIVEAKRRVFGGR